MAKLDMNGRTRLTLSVPTRRLVDDPLTTLRDCEVALQGLVAEAIYAVKTRLAAEEGEAQEPDAPAFEWNSLFTASGSHSGGLHLQVPEPRDGR